MLHPMLALHTSWSSGAAALVHCTICLAGVPKPTYYYCDKLGHFCDFYFLILTSYGVIVMKQMVGYTIVCTYVYDGWLL